MSHDVYSNTPKDSKLMCLSLFEIQDSVFHRSILLGIAIPSNNQPTTRLLDSHTRMAAANHLLGAPKRINLGGWIIWLIICENVYDNYDILRYIMIIES